MSHKQHKYNAKKVVIDGHKFPSIKEGEVYKKLKLQELRGSIQNLELQPKFVLQEGFLSHGKKIQPITYTADFRFQENGETIIVEAKGFKTKDYRLRKKMFLYRYWDLIFREV